MLENPKQKEWIESGHDAGEPEIKRRDRIWARCWRTQNKKKGLNPGRMSVNPKQKEGIESGHDARESETNRRDRI